ARSSGSPAAGVYFVRPASIAALPAAATWAGVGWSGSPTLKSSTRPPLALSAPARWAMATVGDTSRLRTRRESRGPGLVFFIVLFFVSLSYFPEPRGGPVGRPVLLAQAPLHHGGHEVAHAPSELEDLLDQLRGDVGV